MHKDIVIDQQKFTVNGSLDIGVKIISLMFSEGTFIYGFDKMEGNLTSNELYIGGSIGIYLNKLL